MIRSLFSIDTRSLAALRIGLASLILYRAITERAPDSTPPPAGFFELLTAYAGALVVPFAVMLLLGYKTRLATVLTWLVYTIPIREDLLTSGSTVFLGNYILALMLFWGFFLPLGDTLSIDSRQRSASGPTRFLSIASGGILLQVFVIYFSAGITRDIGEWLFQADALETILGQTRFASELGRSMTEFPILLAALSIATIALELIGTVLLFVPGKSLEQRRVLVVIAFILCPADYCDPAQGITDAGNLVKGYIPPDHLVEEAARIIEATGADLGGVEYLVNDLDGEAYFYDINVLSNFVADAVNVVGFDPFVQLVDLIEDRAMRRVLA